jgi:hypothetical protein
MSWPPADGKPYRPSNGTEGECFMEGWCNRCKADRAHQDSAGEEPGCDIIARSMAFDVGEPGYPVQWVWKDGEPTCTAFDDVVLQITNEERAAQMVLL